MTEKLSHEKVPNDWAYLYQVNGKYRCSKIHPNDLDLEHSTDYIQPAQSGDKKPDVVFAGNELLWAIAECESLEEFEQAIMQVKSRVDEITHEAFLPDE